MDKVTKSYLEAARIIAEKDGIYSCIAVEDVFEEWGTKGNRTEKYLNVFWPGKLGQSPPKRHNLFIEGIERGYSMVSPVPVNHRVMMLCLMAACWRDFK